MRVVDKQNRSAITNTRFVEVSNRFQEEIKSCLAFTLVAVVRLDHLASREMLEGVVERLTERLKVATASLKSMSEDFRQALEKLETLEKEHKRHIHHFGELKEKESKLIRERDEARESAKKSLEKVSQMESKQLARNSQLAKSTAVKPEKFSGSGNDTDFQAF